MTAKQDSVERAIQGVMALLLSVVVYLSGRVHVQVAEIRERMATQEQIRQINDDIWVIKADILTFKVSETDINEKIKDIQQRVKLLEQELKAIADSR